MACGGGKSGKRDRRWTELEDCQRAREAETKRWQQRSRRGVDDECDSRLETATIRELEGDVDNTVRAPMLEQRAMKRRVRLQWIEAVKVARSKGSNDREGSGLWHDAARVGSNGRDDDSRGGRKRAARWCGGGSATAVQGQR
ncbi:hypothetical protein BHE74_00057343 [Ensete ventricosum]|nr:hypothetical protein BHE74_00057343 [Ensete ventricosum]